MISRTTRKIAKLERNSTFDTIPRWRDIEAYEISPTELFARHKTHYATMSTICISACVTGYKFNSEEVSGLTSLH
jgi:hypothetical protein